MTATAPTAASRTPRRRHRGRTIIAGLVIVAAIGFLLFKGLGNATLYFRTADEAVAQHAKLGTQRFRIEGVVVPGSIKGQGVITAFSIVSKGVTVPVENQGQPVGIFQENIPVVLEGRFASAASDTFESDRVMVKHSADYTAQHPDRVSGGAN